MIATTDGEICIACLCSKTTALPIPNDFRSMLSDGQIIQKPLAKVLCMDCGLIFHSRAVLETEVRQFYSESYALHSTPTKSDFNRGEIYANEVSQSLSNYPEPNHILDVGCGSGALIQLLSQKWKKSSFIGIDPHPPKETENSRLHFSKTFLSELKSDTKFDLITSVNSIEHSSNPLEFLKSMRQLCHDESHVVLICPSAFPTNDEILFFDHLWTFSKRAFALLALKAGFDLTSIHDLTSTAGDFTKFHLRLNRAIPQKLREDLAFNLPQHQLKSCHKFLDEWKLLDSRLLQLLSKKAAKIQIFGAGQMAALIRTYAPQSWKLVKRLVVDAPSEAWPLGDITTYISAESNRGWSTLIGVHPRTAAKIAARISNDGGEPILLPLEEHS